MHDIVQQHMDSPAMWAIFPLQVQLIPLTLDAALHHFQAHALLMRRGLRLQHFTGKPTIVFLGCRRAQIAALRLLWQACSLHIGCWQVSIACAWTECESRRLLQDLLALSDKYNGRPATEETINDPTVRKHYWRYRCHVDLETLLEDKVFVLNIQRMLLGKHHIFWPLPVSMGESSHQAFSSCHGTVGRWMMQV